MLGGAGGSSNSIRQLIKQRPDEAERQFIRLRAEVEQLTGLQGCCLDECPAKAALAAERALSDELAEALEPLIPDGVDNYEDSFVDAARAALTAHDEERRK